MVKEGLPEVGLIHGTCYPPPFYRISRKTDWRGSHARLRNSNQLHYIAFVISLVFRREFRNLGREISCACCLLLFPVKTAETQPAPISLTLVSFARLRGPLLLSQLLLLLLLLQLDAA